jgi:hypothetical protein
MKVGSSFVDNLSTLFIKKQLPSKEPDCHNSPVMLDFGGVGPAIVKGIVTPVNTIEKSSWIGSNKNLCVIQQSGPAWQRV